MKVSDIAILTSLNDIPHLMNAETVIIPTDTAASDEATADKLQQLFDTAWAVMHKRKVKNGNLTEADHDASVERLVSVFRTWVASGEIGAEDVKKS